MIRLRVGWTGTGITGGGVSTHYFGGVGQSVADQAGIDLAAFWTAIVDAAVAGSALARIETSADQIDENTGKITDQFSISPPSIPTASSTGITSPATQILVNWGTATFVNGRRLRGRTFVPSVKASVVTASGELNGSVRTTVAEAAEDLSGDVTSLLQVWSRTHLTAAKTITTDVPNELAVLRSRRD